MLLFIPSIDYVFYECTERRAWLPKDCRTLLICVKCTGVWEDCQTSEGELEEVRVYQTPELANCLKQS